MNEKYFLHRIQRENGTFSKGIEVHDTLDSAILSYWGRSKLAFYANPAIDVVFVKITDINGNRVDDYETAWKADGVDLGNIYFMHHIMLTGENFSKDIDICDNFNVARITFASTMEYGYGNPRHSDVKYVSCEITDDGGVVMNPYKKYWVKPEEEPEE